MHDVTAELIERRRTADPAAVAHKRRLAMNMREAREKLTSTGSGQRTFDVELLRIFAARQREAMPVLAGLALAVAWVATLWTPFTSALIWLGLVFASGAASWIFLRRYGRESDAAPRLKIWQRRFAALETLRALAWASLAGVLPHAGNLPAQTFTTFVLLQITASAAMLSSTLPLAIYASLIPATGALLLLSGPGSGAMPLLFLALTGQAFLGLLSRRLYSTALETLSFQAEKDALIVELEQARLNSDEARRRAEEASLAKSRFLATMSHELRTPLNAILGFSEVMKGELFGAHAVPTYRDYSNDIHSSGQHLLVLINEILDLSRVEAGRYDLREEPVALFHVVEDCRHLLTLRAAKRDITMQEVIEPGLPRIWADERAMRQIVLNLLSNAIKFTPQGGTVTLRVGWTPLGGQYVSIRDTGPGIPEHEIPVIMSSFGRGTLAQKNADEGSGLGLPIVKGLIELHGGTFTLTSKVREGTEVVMTLPPQRIIEALAPLRDEEAAPSRRSRRPTVRSAA